MYKHTVLPWIMTALQVATILLAMVSEKYNYMVTKLKFQQKKPIGNHRLKKKEIKRKMWNICQSIVNFCVYCHL